MRKSSLVEVGLRRKLPGLNYIPKLWICNQGIVSGRGALYTGWSHTERSGGQYTRENAGISSESTVRICAAENLRFPGEGSSAQGKSGPNARPKGVVDGKQVKDSCTTDMYWIVGDACKETKRANGKVRTARWSENSSEVVKLGDKKSQLGAYRYSYRKPTQVGRKRIFRRTGEALLRNSAN